LETLEEKFVLDKISEEVYKKLSAKYEADRDEIKMELSKSAFDSSNWEKEKMSSNSFQSRCYAAFQQI
jgi:hypothetical protein